VATPLFWQKNPRLYRPKEGLYLAPRAPTDTWDLWHQAHIDDFFDQLIRDLILSHGIDSDRVYLTGYSAGGDGVYQLAPRMADRFAAAGMMAGHPNETQPDGLRNLPFALHVGAEDSPYDRNKIAAQWKTKLAELAANDPGGYVNQCEVHAGKGHWMDREEAPALEWMASHTRDLRPKRIVWLQDDVLHARFYWLRNSNPKARERIVVGRDGQNFEVFEAPPSTSLALLLDDSMCDLDREIVVRQGATELFRGKVKRSPEALAKTLAERGDPRGMFPAELPVVTVSE
jgi:dienelactone hydrolase